LATFRIDPEFDGLFRYPLRSGIGRALYHGGYESAELAYVRSTLKAGQTFFDVGANGGIFTINAARRVGESGQVHCFEPGMAELELLRLNVALNRLSNVRIYAGAVSQETGSAEFATAEDGAMSSLAKTDHPGQVITRWRTVSTITLDDYARQQGVARVDFIKIDVEGAEKLVFAGASSLLKSSAPLTVLFEAFDLNAKGFGYSVESFLQDLLQRGLNLFYFDARGELVPIHRYEPRFGKEIYSFVAKT
jgi:FkbM family methyltransferase